MNDVWRALTVSIPVEDYETLQEMARLDHRRPRDEAGVLLSAAIARARGEAGIVVDRGRPCLLDSQCCRYQGHDGKHLYPDTE